MATNVVLNFTLERQAALQKECDLYNAANPAATWTFAQFCQAIAQNNLDVRADSAIARAATPPTRAEFDQMALDNARLVAEAAKSKDLPPPAAPVIAK
jgi:hypothetical protein